MLKFIFVGLLCIPFIVLAQDNGAPLEPFPWADNAIVVLVVTTAIGLLQRLLANVGGGFGKVVRWLIDTLGSNVQHK